MENKHYKIFVIIFMLLFLILLKNMLNKNISNILKIINISIIIPVYNSEKTISLCLNSVIKQSIKNIEIICIDDGSTDKSLKILKEFKNLDNRIKLIHQKNQGSGVARNIGIKNSKGLFIAFIDSDDVYPNNFILELMFNKAIENNALICGGGIAFFHIYKNKIKLIKNNNIEFKNNEIINYFNYQYDWFYQRFIYNKNFIKKNKLYFPKYLRYQDPPFFIKTMAIAKVFYALKNITYFYRISNKKKIIDEKSIIDLYKGIKDCLDICKSMNLYKLYYRVLSHLNDEIIIKRAKQYIKSKNLKSVISQIINNINFNILKKENYTFNQNIFYNELK